MASCSLSPCIGAGGTERRARIDFWCAHVCPGGSYIRVVLMDGCQSLGSARRHGTTAPEAVLCCAVLRCVVLCCVLCDVVLYCAVAACLLACLSACLLPACPCSCRCPCPVAPALALAPSPSPIPPTKRPMQRNCGCAPFDYVIPSNLSRHRCAIRTTPRQLGLLSLVPSQSRCSLLFRHALRFATLFALSFVFSWSPGP